jgi:hypothetical protein
MQEMWLFGKLDPPPENAADENEVDLADLASQIIAVASKRRIEQSTGVS